MNPLRLALFAIITFITQVSYAQNSALVDGSLLTQEELVEDYDLLFSSLTNYHPAPFLFISKEELEAYYLDQRARLHDSISEREFYIIARKLITLLKCGHTTGRISGDWMSALSGNAVLLPFNVYHSDSRVYIKNTVDEQFDFQTGDELLSINNVPIETILTQMDSIQPRDGYIQSFANVATALSFRMYYLFLYGYQNTFTIEYRSGASTKKTVVKSIPKKIKSTSKPALPKNFDIVYSNSWSLFAFDTLQDIAYLKIQSFTDRKEFDSYYKRVFQELERFPKSRLIIDLRNNTGGYFGNGNELLCYLSPEKFDFNFQRPKKDFKKNEYAKLNGWGKLTKLAFSLKPAKHRSKGYRIHTFSYRPKRTIYDDQVYVITNGLTLSQASVVASSLNEYGAIFFGTETGGTENSNNAMLVYTLELPNSKFKAKIPYYQVISNSSKGEKGRGVIPDYGVSTVYDTDRDNVLEEVLKIVLKK